MKKRRSSRNQGGLASIESTPSPSLDFHKENIPLECEKPESPASMEPESEDPQPSTIAEADRVEKLQLAKLQDRKSRIRYNPASQCPCCGRITPGSRHIA